jgi:hypothetical protein
MRVPIARATKNVGAERFRADSIALSVRDAGVLAMP